MIRPTLIALLLAGCAGQWERTGATQADLSSDQAQCRYEAEKAVAAVDNAVAAGMRQGQITVSCMRVRGWTR